MQTAIGQAAPSLKPWTDLTSHLRGVLMGLAFCMALLAGPQALAQSVGAHSPAGLFRSGQFLLAADAAERSGGADNLALAARALLAYGALDAADRDIDPLADRAIRACEAALAANPNHVEARVQLAIALGVKGRRMSATAALSSGFAQRGRTLLEEAVTLDPADPWARAALAGWHLEVWRRGGLAGATLLGADQRRGLALLAAARRLDPANPSLALNQALALLEADPVRYQATVQLALDQAVSLPARDALERRMQTQAVMIREQLAGQGPRAAATFAQAVFF